MTAEDFKALKSGDIVRHKTDSDAYIVHDNFGNRVTAVRIADLTNPNEWDLVVKQEPVKSGERNNAG